jgi:hypothetical protein
MKVNVLSWKQALAQGRCPASYTYLFEEIPPGEYRAMLDYKIWAKKLMAISCYFTQVTTGIKMQLTVYCNESGVYHAGTIDFATCPVQEIYLIRVADQKKKIRLVHAVLVDE